MSDRDATYHGKLMDEYLEIWNEAAYDKIPGVCSDTITIHDPGYPEVVAGQEAVQPYLEELRTAFPDFTIEILDLLEREDLVMSEWRFTGTNAGEFAGLPATGNEVDLQGMDKIKITAGAVEEHVIYHNLQELFDQLGLTKN